MPQGKRGVHTWCPYESVGVRVPPYPPTTSDLFAICLSLRLYIMHFNWVHTWPAIRLISSGELGRVSRYVSGVWLAKYENPANHNLALTAPLTFKLSWGSAQWINKPSSSSVEIIGARSVADRTVFTPMNPVDFSFFNVLLFWFYPEFIPWAIFPMWAMFVKKPSKAENSFVKRPSQLAVCTFYPHFCHAIRRYDITPPNFPA